MQDYEEFKERVMAALTASKIPARAIAAGTGISPSFIGKLLAGQVKNPDRSITLNRLAAYFGIPYDREGTGGEGHDLVSTKEAAWMLGLSDVTVLNLIEAGALRTVRTGRGPGGRHFISRRAVEEMVPEAAPLRVVMEALAKVRDEMESELRCGILDVEEARQARDAFIGKYYGVEDVAALVGISEYFFERILGVGNNAEKLSEREKSVLRQRLAGRSMAYIRESEGLTMAGVRAALERAKGVLMTLRTSFEDNDVLKAENEALRKECEALRAALVHEQEVNVRRRDEEAVAVAAREANVQGDVLLSRMYEKGYTLDTSVKMLPLSVRLKNGLRSGGVETLRDILSQPRGKIRKFRSLGRKSMDELDAFLGLIGLRVGMLETE